MKRNTLSNGEHAHGQDKKTLLGLKQLHKKYVQIIKFTTAQFSPHCCNTWTDLRQLVREALYANTDQELI